VSAFDPQTRTTAVLGCVLAGLTAWIAAPAPARACGGTFCDAGPSVMPVDQTGENVMFVVAEGQVEAHIQIQYTGDPERFAWIVPVMAEPTVEVGSDPLFTELLDSTVPTFSVNTQTENCAIGSGGGGGGGGFGCGVEGTVASAFQDEEPSSGLDDDEEPTVHERDLAGSYEYVVLEGGTIEGIIRWLDENEFAQDDDAPPILQEYLDDGFMFVAFKLRSGYGVDQIHPIVIRYEGDEPCVPLRLTRIAASEDMGVRTFFLGRDRVVPTNFRHVQLNPLKLDWVNTGSNYDEAVTLAVDEDGADGQAFVTEYAGSSDVLAPEAVFNGRWRSDPFREATPDNLTDLLADRQLMVCVEGDCFSGHPLVPPLLQAYFPPPPGVAPGDFYSCTSCYADWEPDQSATDGGDTDGGDTDGDTDGDTTSGSDTGGTGDGTTGTSGGEESGSTGVEGTDTSDTDDAGGSTDSTWLESWDAEGFADALEEQVVLPGQHALAVIQKHPYLTRMYTTLSPSEMTRDPIFSAIPGLPDVDNVWNATYFNRCDGPDRVLFDDGQVMWFDDNDTPPRFADMPYAQVVEEYFSSAPMALRDNREAIDAELEAWNEEHAGPEITPDDTMQDDDESQGGCSCTSDTPLRGSGVLTVLLLLGLRSRRLRPGSRT